VTYASLTPPQLLGLGLSRTYTSSQCYGVDAVGVRAHGIVARLGSTPAPRGTCRWGGL